MDEDKSDGGFRLSWQNLITSIGLVFVLVGGFWALAYIPIQENIREIKQSIGEIRSQTEIRRADAVTRSDVQTALQTTRLEFLSEIRRLDQATKDSMNRQEFNAWKDERDRLIATIMSRLDKLESLVLRNNTGKN